MEEDITKMSLVELITRLTKIDQKIDLLTIEYELLRKELIRRYPMFEEQEEFKRK